MHNNEFSFIALATFFSFVRFAVIGYSGFSCFFCGTHRKAHEVWPSSVSDFGNTRMFDARAKGDQFGCDDYLLAVEKSDVHMRRCIDSPCICDASDIKAIVGLKNACLDDAFRIWLRDFDGHCRFGFLEIVQGAACG